MEFYLEQSATLEDGAEKIKTKRVLVVIKFVCLAISILSLLVFFLTLMDVEGNFSPIPWIIFTATVPVFFFVLFLFFRKKTLNLNLEYDYVINGKRFWVYKIINRIKRKPYLDLDILKFEEIGRVDQPQFPKRLHEAKEYNACANVKDSNHYVLTRVKGEKAIVYLELEDETISAINKTLGKNILVRVK